MRFGQPIGQLVQGAHSVPEGETMRTGILRVVLLLALFASSFPFLTDGQGRDATPLVRVNEGGARLVLKEKSSTLSMELSADTIRPIAAMLTAGILAPDDKLLAEVSVPVSLSSIPVRAEAPLKWVPAVACKMP